MQDLLKKIKKNHWVWFWSGNWPLLDNLPLLGTRFEKKFSQIAGTAPRKAVIFFKKGICTVYHSQEEYDRLEKHFMNNFKENPSFIKNSFKDYQKITSADIKELEKINKIKINKLSNKELIFLLKKKIKHFSYNWAMDHYSWYIEKYFIPVLQDYLEKKLKKFGKLNQLASYTAILVTPTKSSQIFIERKSFFNLIKIIKKNKDLVNDIKLKKAKETIFKKNSNIYSLIKKHLDKYNWLPVLVNNPPTSLNDLWNEIVYFVINNETFKIESKRIGDNFDKDIILKKKKIISELKPDKTTLKLIKGLEETAFARTESNAIMSKSSYLMIPLLTEIARRLGLTYHELKEFTPEEIINFLEKNREIPKILLRSRLKLTCYVQYNDIEKLFFEKEAFKIKKIIEAQLKETKKKLTVFYGTPANMGKAKGKVKLALSSKDAMDIEKGEILVAPATSADFVPAMRKAAAIITEFGGLTSHAAIVSREFKIPCIVGVRDITKFLKDGDIIDVDADKGLIKIKKKQKTI